MRIYEQKGSSVKFNADAQALFIADLPADETGGYRRF
jgi:hypothetical protein